MKEKFEYMQKAIYGRGGIWSRGYCVSSIGLNEKAIFKYVEHQGKEDSGQLVLELTPFLLKVLDDVLKDPDKYAEDENYFGHIYAVMLLAHFKETSAYKRIIELFSLPEKTLDILFADMVTENLPMLLYNTCGNSFEEIKLFIRNKNVYEFCRISAMHALVYAVADCALPREEALKFFGSLFTGNEAEEGSFFWGSAANYITDLHPGELIKTLESAYGNGLIPPSQVTIEEIREQTELSIEECLRRVKEDMISRSLDDIHGRMSWWACFHKLSPI